MYVPPSSADAPRFPAAAHRYEIGAEIARGGMGVVHRGRDAAFGRDIAIKLLLPEHRENVALVNRFFDEARIVGQLQHPGIPPIYDVGTMPDEQPFLAMKLIKGKTLYMAMRDGDQMNVLAVFESICRAVGYAHDRRVVHRDLKPENVMVGAFGEVQVMDWGLAKVLPECPEPAADTDAVTEIVSLRGDADGTASRWPIGTPQYMPPEQATGDLAQIDRQSDVFSLGGLLGAMLTDQPVYVAADRAARLQMAKNADTVPAFARLDACGADPELIELCKWCLLAKKEDRPADGNEVAAAVSALRAAADERARQAEQERAAAVAQAIEQRKRRRWASALLGIALFSGLVAASQWWRAEDARRAEADQLGKTEQALIAKTAEEQAKGKALALADANLAEATRNLAARDAARERELAALRRLTDEFVEEQLNRRPELTAESRKFLTEVLALWQSVADTRGDKAETRGLRAEGSFRVGLVWFYLGDLTNAEESYRAAVAIWESLAAELPDRPDYRQHLAHTQNNLGLLLASTGRTSDAEVIYRANLVVRSKLVVEFPDQPDYRKDLATTQTNLGALLEASGRSAEAVQAYQAALGLLKTLSVEYPKRQDYKRELATIQNNLGTLFKDTGRLEAAEAVYRDALVNWGRLVAEFRNRPDCRQGQAHAQANLGVLLASAGRLAEAERAYNDALATQMKLVAEFPSRPDYRRDEAATQHNLGILLDAASRPVEAETAYKTALAAREKLTGEFPSRPDYRRDLASTQTNLGALLEAAGRPAEAEAEYRAAVVNWGRLVAEFPSQPDYRQGIAHAQTNLGMLLVAAGRPVEAETAYRNALAVEEKLTAEFPDRPDYRRDLAATQNSLGFLLRTVGRRTEAETAYKDALVIRDKLANQFPERLDYLVDLCGSYCNLGHLLRDIDRLDDSLGMFTKAIGTLAPIHMRDVQQLQPRRFLWIAYIGRAMTLDKQNRSADAIADWDSAISMTPEAERVPLQVGRTLSLLRAGKVDQAISDADTLAASPRTRQPDHLYDIVCVYSIASDRIPARREEYAGRAMGLLKKAVTAGYRNTAHMWQDADLDPLRSRPDFRQLLTDLGATREPAPKPRPVK